MPENSPETRSLLASNYPNPLSGLERFDCGPWPRVMEDSQKACPQFAPHGAHSWGEWWCPGVKEGLTGT